MYQQMITAEMYGVNRHFVNNIKFEDVARDLDIQGETIESVKLFDMCIKNLFK